MDSVLRIISNVFDGFVETLHRQKLRKVAQDVISPLMGGLRSFNHVSEMLLCMEPGVILHHGSQRFRDIREQIENMHQQMEESLCIAKTELQHIDGETENLTMELSSLANQKRQREGELKGLKINLETYRSNLQSYSQSLQVEKRNLESAEKTRDRMKKRRDEAETMSYVGAGLFAIPIAGWIAGGIIIGVSLKEWEEANAAVDKATTEVGNCQSQVNYYSGKVSEYNSNIDQAERDIRMADDRIKSTEAKLRSVSVRREFVIDFQEKIRRAVHQVGLLSGVGSVAELQTRHTIVLEPVIQVFEEMTTALSRITGNDLLHTEGMLSLMDDMRENQKKLKQLVGSSRSLTYNSYY